jgi:rSAM/selenodomain-associated transferase 2
MRAPVSVIIPTLNAATTLPSCAAALMEGLNAGLIREVIVTDGGSTDATCQIADEIGAEIVTGPPSRGGQIRRGCQVAKAEWLLILHADTQLAPGWSEPVADHLGQTAPATFRLAYDLRGAGATITAAWANLRTRIFRLPYGDQGMLIRSETLGQIGHYPDIPLMEDVALARRLPALKILPVTARTSFARYAGEGWLRRGARNLWLLLRYLAGADPHALVQAYRRSSRRS